MLPKALLYIDGQATYVATKQIGISLDFKRLLAHYRASYTIPRAVYATLTTADLEYDSLRPLLDFLQFNGWQTLTRGRISYTDAAGVAHHQNSIDTMLAMDAYEFANIVRPEIFFLFSGDNALFPLIRPLQRLGIRVHLVSTVHGTDKFCDPAMRRVVDDFTDLVDLAPLVELRRRAPEPEPELEPEPEILDPRDLVDTTPKPVVVERRKVIRRGAGH
jgi:uncharacterized LabA/DUF88 family protein